jgi:hypothetical protein
MRIFIVLPFLTLGKNKRWGEECGAGPDKKKTFLP